MYFSKLEPLLNPLASGAGAFDIRQANPYRLHQTLYQFFPDTPPKHRPFLFREDAGRRSLPKVYLLSERKPQNQGAWALASKPYQPVIKNHQSFVFSLRANPVVCQNGKRHDVVMAKLHPLKAKGETYDRAKIIREQGLAWLGRKAAEFGFSFADDTVRVSGYRQVRLPKPGKRPTIRFSLMDFDGCLTVVDPEAFREGLLEGIGRGKGFGCGMLMIKRL